MANPTQTPPSRKQELKFRAVFVLFMSGILSCVLSAVAYFMARGFSAETLLGWLPVWGRSWLIAFPVAFVVVPVARKLTQRVLSRWG